MTDHPEWVWRRAAEVLNEKSSVNYAKPYHRGPDMLAVASLIAKHERPPVDPDEEVVITILSAAKIWLSDTKLADALAAYKALMASRNT